MKPFSDQSLRSRDLGLWITKEMARYSIKFVGYSENSSLKNLFKKFHNCHSWIHLLAKHKSVFEIPTTFYPLGWDLTELFNTHYNLG